MFESSFPEAAMASRSLPVALSLTIALTVGSPAQQVSQSTVTDAMKRLHWRSVGPANNAGRISVVVGVPGNRDVYYVAGANGGVIKTTNGGGPLNAIFNPTKGGVPFKPIFDRQNIGSIGAIAISPSDPNIIYVGTGEENPRNNAS